MLIFLTTFSTVLGPLLWAAADKTQAIDGRIDTPFFRLTLSNGVCAVLDKQSGQVWRSEAERPRLVDVVLKVHEAPRLIQLSQGEARSTRESLELLFHPLDTNPSAALRVWLRALPDQKTLELAYQADTEIQIQSLTLLPDLLTVTDAGKGYLAVPVREGLLIPADSDLEFTHRFDTYAYEGCHMAMLGAVQNGAAVLATWQDPYVAVDVKSLLSKDKPAGNRQRICAAVTMSKSAHAFQIQFLGPGDYVTLSKAYRRVAQARGWLVTWDQKLKTNRQRAKLFGAANIKLWSVLDRRMNEDSSKELSVRVNWTFDEAAEVAEHFKQDLRLDRVLFTLGGWIHRGYDNQHPDILPTAPECGGDAAFTNCARRILALGYLFCLHDNYQDIYRDSPSWDEKFIMRTRDQKLAKGGHWAGGTAYLTCSQMALELAKRPQNLPAVKQLSGANSYFIDTTYAAGLQECFALAHPLQRADDMKWKQGLSDYARSLFGVFGSECGREWAIPHSDFFEGLTGVSGRDYHDANLTKKLGATVVPLFELVYRDTIAMYGKYGYDPRQAADYVLHHICLGRTLNYHSIPPHLYWKKSAPPESEETPPAQWGDPALFVHGQNGWAAGLHPLDRFIKNTCEVLGPLNELTSQMPMTRHEFLTPNRTVQRSVFGAGPRAVRVVVNTGQDSYSCTAADGSTVLLPKYGFLIESPEYVAFCAAVRGTLHYETPTLFTLRSLDRKPLSRSQKIRVFHGFGNDRITVRGATQTVRTETIF